MLISIINSGHIRSNIVLYDWMSDNNYSWVTFVTVWSLLTAYNSAFLYL